MISARLIVKQRGDNEQERDWGLFKFARLPRIGEHIAVPLGDGFCHVKVRDLLHFPLSEQSDASGFEPSVHVLAYTGSLRFDTGL